MAVRIIAFLIISTLFLADLSNDVESQNNKNNRSGLISPVNSTLESHNIQKSNLKENTKFLEKRLSGLSKLLTHWGKTKEIPEGIDVNSDGIIDELDFAEMVSSLRSKYSSIQ